MTSTIISEPVQNKKGRGRPRSFEEGAALDQAMKLFWSKGFDATSVDELAAAMGIGRPSMYNAFGDKEAIFMRCLARYDATVAVGPFQAMQESATAPAAIATYLEAVAQAATSDPSHRGCLLVSTIVDDPKVRRFVTERLDAAAELIAERLTAGVAAGELPARFPIAARARRTINVMLAIAARARHGATREELLVDARDGTEAALA